MVESANDRTHVPIAMHLAAVAPASVIGAIIMASKKGTRRHVLLGRVWVGAMVTASISSFGVTEIMPNRSFSPIHGLSIFALYSLANGIYAIRNGNVKRHKNFMQGCLLGLTGAGIATLLPGRRIHDWIFNGKLPWLTKETSSTK